MSWKRKLSRWILYPLFTIIVLFFTLWLLSPWLLTLPVVQNEIKQQVKQRTGGEINFESLSLTLLGSLAGREITYIHDTPKGKLDFYTNYAQVSYFFTPAPNVYAENVNTGIAGKEIIEVSSVEVDISDAWNSPLLSIVINKAKLQPYHLADVLSATTEVKKATQPPKLDFIKQIRFQNSSVSSPNVATPYQWSGTVIPNGTHGQILSATVAIRPATRNLSDQVTNVYANFNVANSTDFNVVLEAADFPIQFASPVSIQTKLNGQATFLSSATQDYQLESSLVFDSLRYEKQPAVEIPYSSLRLNSQFTRGFTPKYATISITHSSSIIKHDKGGKNIDDWTVPSGIMSTEIQSITAPLTLQWQMKDFANITAKSPEVPTSASAPIDIHLELLEQTVDTLLSHIPFKPGDVLGPLQGNIQLTADLKIADQTLKNYAGQMSITNGNWPITVAHLHHTNLSGPINGSLKEHHIKLSGDTGLLLSFDEQRELELNPQNFIANVDILANPFEVHVDIPTIQTEHLKDVQFSFDTPDKWEVTGNLNTEASLTEMVNNLAPDFPRNIQGMGNLDLRANGTGEMININLTSPDLTVLSFDEEPTFGLQLREFVSKTDIAVGKEPTVTTLGFTGQHPYVSFDAGDIEWPTRELQLDAKMISGKTTSYDATIYPPGDGTIHITNNDSGTYRFEFNNTDVGSFALPVLNQVFLKPVPDKPSPFDATGKLEGWLTLDSNNNIQGEAKLLNTNAYHTGPPTLQITQAEATIPFAYPIELNRFPSKTITFNAQQLSIADSTFDDISATFPLDASKIVVARDVTFDIFGGELFIDNLEINNWQDLPAGIQGAFEIDSFQFEHLHELYPFLPTTGTLSGSIRNISYSDNLFELNSNLIAQVFDGEIGLQNITIEEPFEPRKTISLEVWIDSIDLENLTAYLNYGKMTGQITGQINNLTMVLPPAGTTEWPKPLAFDIEVRKVGNKVGQINRTALKKIIDLSKQPNIAQAIVDREAFYYTDLGLQASLRGNELILNGTAKNDSFLYADEVNRIFNPSLWGTIPVTINFPNEKPIAFNELWQRLQAQVRGSASPQVNVGF